MAKVKPCWAELGDLFMTLNCTAMPDCNAQLTFRIKDALDTVSGADVFGDILKVRPISINSDT